MEEATKLQVANLQLKRIAQVWWDTQLEISELIVELGTPPSPTNGSIDSWDAFCQALRKIFYPLGYLQNIITKWLKIHQLST
jgi:hypothetical protein